ncbi:MAG: glucose-6-phosphate dehydrogenase [Verrucomicrobiia bacterium]
MLHPDLDSFSTRAAKSFIMVIFGASGDLTHRKLVPALFGLFKEKSLPENFHIIGFARRDKSDDQFRDELLTAAQKYSRFAPIDPNEWAAFASHLHYHIGNFDDPSAYQSLRDRLRQLTRPDEAPQEIFYLSTAPEFFSIVVQELATVELVGHHKPARVVVEKPFGHDLASARQLVSDFQKCLDESNLYRIDHYLGKETVQNLLYFRFANSIYEPIWNRSLIDNVQITVAEEEGVGTRGGYYDGVGALRDMVQNHLMQLLTITAMEPPATLNSEALRDEKVKVLRSIPTPDASTVPDMTVLAQYEGYRQADRVNPKSTTETYAAIKLVIDNWRWAGVPFYLRTGKAMATRGSEIVVVFKRPPLALFGAGKDSVVHRNRMHIRLQPNEGVHLRFNAKIPGRRQVDGVDMDFAYKSKYGSYSPEAYERLLHDAIVGDSTLFTRADEVLEAWRIIDAIRENLGSTPPALYRVGSWGPHEAEMMLKADGNSWVDFDITL